MLNLAVAERYELKSYSFSHNTARMKELVDIASAEGKWLVLYLHNMDNKVTASQVKGDFWPREELLFSPSGARGRYRNELFNWFYLYRSQVLPSLAIPLPANRAMQPVILMKYSIMEKRPLRNS